MISCSMTVGCQSHELGVVRARRQHHPRQAALVGVVAAAGRVVGRDLRDAPDAVDAVVVDGIGIVGGQAVGEDEHVARGRADRRRRRRRPRRRSSVVVAAAT